MDDSSKSEGPSGQYANSLNVGFNQFEFVLDFGQFYPGQSEAYLCARIITGPSYAKTFSRILGDAVAGYEQAHGPIPEA